MVDGRGFSRRLVVVFVVFFSSQYNGCFRHPVINTQISVCSRVLCPQGNVVIPADQTTIGLEERNRKLDVVDVDVSRHTNSCRAADSIKPPTVLHRPSALPTHRNTQPGHFESGLVRCPGCDEGCVPEDKDLARWAVRLGWRRRIQTVRLPDQNIKDQFLEWSGAGFAL